MNRIAVEHSRTREVIAPDMAAPDRPQVLLRWGDTVNRVAMQRTERRIGLRLFGRWFGYESSTTERQVETLQLTQAEGIVPAALPAPRGQVALAGGGVLAIALLGGAIGALLVPASPQAAGQVLTVLPDSRPIALPAQSSLPRQPLAAAARAPQPAALATPPAAAPVSGTMTIDPSADPATDASLTLAQARATALSSGEPAYWAEGTRSGVVVAGPERSDSGQLCRLVAVFTRVDGDRGTTQSTTQCRAAVTAKN